MSGFHKLPAISFASREDMEVRPETPPPPYNLEDPHTTSISHNPELAELDAGVPYKVRGPFLPCNQTPLVQVRELIFVQMMVASTLI